MDGCRDAKGAPRDAGRDVADELWVRTRSAADPREAGPPNHHDDKVDSDQYVTACATPRDAARDVADEQDVVA